MHIFCLSKLNFDDEYNREVIKKILLDVETEDKKIDMILSLGDNPATLLEYMMEELEKRNLKIPVLGILGPEDTWNMFKRGSLKRIKDIGNNNIAVLDKFFIGIHGGNIYKDSSHPAYSQEDAMALMKSKPTNADFLVSYNPPWGIHDGKSDINRGFKGISWYMQKFEPHFIIHAHREKSIISWFRQKTFVVGIKGFAILNTSGKPHITPIMDSNSNLNRV